MSTKDKFTVRQIQTHETYEWMLKKHYAKRIPQISWAFGLFDNDALLVGVCTFGAPCRQMNNGDSIFGGVLEVKTLELNRLVVNEGLGKNVLSYFVGSCLRMLPKPCCVVSYADDSKGHHGYIYQATNWKYTGLNQVHEREIIYEDKELHPRTAWEIAKREGYSNTSEWVKNTPNACQLDYTKKHRYFQFLGNKKEKQKMESNLAYEIIKYPKGANVRYDATYSPTVQMALF